MVRWDSPLFTVPWTDEDVPAEDIWAAITGGTVKPPNAGTQAVGRSAVDNVRLGYASSSGTKSTDGCAENAREYGYFHGRRNNG